MKVCSVNSKIKILYLGPQSGTCLDRANAYKRLGHEVFHLDPRMLLPRGQWIDQFVWRVGGAPFAKFVEKKLRSAIPHTETFDVCHIDGGHLIDRHSLDFLRSRAGRIVNYNIDDPTGPRDGRRFSLYRSSAKYYDLLVVMRNINQEELRALGARNVYRVYMSSDEVSHRRREMTAEEQKRWATEVLFIGTWMPERGPFLAELVRRGVPLTIRGANWHKAPEWPTLRHRWAGGHLHGEDYAMAIQGAVINLGLLSKGNRDQHTTRSMEIPALGGLLCAEKSDEHLALYTENVEAVFWRDASECADSCDWLLRDRATRDRIAAAGHQAHLASEHRNEKVMSSILRTALAEQP